ncbi:MAG TPA: hypothetical protein VIW92_01575 [Thermoanaerobaculia bacterium]
MERLGFLLPDFTRLAWVNDAARSVWEPRFRRITRAWWEIEWRSVAAGLRPCAVVVASPDDLLGWPAVWLRQGLCFLPLEIQGAPEGSLVFRLVLGLPRDLAAFEEASRTQDHAEVGRLLGHPACCYESFRRVWIEDGLVDATWAMAVASSAPEPGAAAIEVAGPPPANILWRWMGIRAVPHLPCRADCGPSVQLGERMIEIGRTAGYAEEMEWLLDILSWPVEWSALHGIAEIKTPVVKVATRTDATAVKYVVRRPGDRMPAEGAHGLGFPYRPPAHPRIASRPATSNVQEAS